MKCIQRICSQIPGNDPASHDLCKIPHPLQQAVGNARRPSRTTGDFRSTVCIYRDLQYAGCPRDDLLQFLRSIKLHTENNAEPVAQRYAASAPARVVAPISVKGGKLMR